MEDNETEFSLEKWHHKLFYYSGLISGVFSFVFWGIMLYVYLKNAERYDRFFNPSTKKFIYLYGVSVFISSVLILILLVVALVLLKDNWARLLEPLAFVTS